MKKKNNSSELVTRGILKEELNNFRNEFNLRFERMEEVFREYRDEVLNKFKISP